LSAVIRGDRLYLPNIGAQSEPPEIFNANVQALVYSVDVDSLAERVAEHVNLNKQIAVETAAPPLSLDKTFGNDLVAIDGNGAGDTFLIVSRGGNQVFRAKPAYGCAGDRWPLIVRPLGKGRFGFELVHGPAKYRSPGFIADANGRR